MPTETQKYGALPFDEAIAFFRDKLSIGTMAWDDIWSVQHSRAFMIAGAMEADLVNDFKAAVDAAIADGESLNSFRERFDDIVARYGWTYKGGRNWRTKVIYDTNMRTAYSAGRYRQMTDPDVLTLRPYWQYRHGGSSDPRPSHLDLDGKVFAHDDPIWNTHFPPNGWGCKCFVVSLSERDLAKRGKTGTDTAPELTYYDYTDQKGRTHRVPEGIDPGFEYNPGKAAARTDTILRDNLTNADATARKT